MQTRRWEPLEIGGAYYLVRMLVRDGASVAAAVALDSLPPGVPDDQVTIAYRRLSAVALMGGAASIESAGIRPGGDAPYDFTGTDRQAHPAPAPSGEPAASDSVTPPRAQHIHPTPSDFSLLLSFFKKERRPRHTLTPPPSPPAPALRAPTRSR